VIPVELRLAAAGKKSNKRARSSLSRLLVPESEQTMLTASIKATIDLHELDSC
jgi:hypothetical protein